MSKRSPGLLRRERDFYVTPPEAVLPLVPHLPRVPTHYVEPCAGDGALIRALAQHWPWGTCSLALDLEPQADHIERGDAFEIKQTTAHLFISNTPWSSPGSKGEPAIGLALHLSSLRPTWLLLPWEFAANRYFSKIEDRCARIVPVGRVSWMGNGVPGKDSCAWYLFDALHVGGPRVMARAA